jgi:hypothetical protein
MVSTLLLVWAALLLGGVLTYLLLMTLILNKTLSKTEPMFFFLLGSGFSLVLFSGLCRAVQLLLL